MINHLTLWVNIIGNLSSASQHWPSTLYLLDRNEGVLRKALTISSRLNYCEFSNV